MEFGDKLIDFEEGQFTHGEAVEITGVPSKTLNNWTQREVVNLGVMHRTGRRLYSIHDLIELKIVGDLSAVVQMPPALAAAAARWARQRSFEMSERDPDGKLIYKGMKAEQRHYLALYFRDGRHEIKCEKGIDWIANYSWPHPLIVVPLDDIVLRISNIAIDVLEREEQAAKHGHDRISEADLKKPETAQRKTKARARKRAARKKR